MTVFDFLNPDSTEVEEQRIISSPGATTGDVLTVQADKSVAAAPGGGSQTFKSATVPLSSADILALHTTPITLVPAEAGTIFIGLWIVFVTHVGNLFYDRDGDLRVFNGNTQGTSGYDTQIDGSCITVSEDSIGVRDLINGAYIGGFGSNNEALEDDVNLPLRLDASAAFHTGNGTVDVTVYYVAMNVT